MNEPSAANAELAAHVAEKFTGRTRVRIAEVAQVLAVDKARVGAWIEEYRATNGAKGIEPADEPSKLQWTRITVAALVRFIEAGGHA